MCEFVGVGVLVWVCGRVGVGLWVLVWACGCGCVGVGEGTHPMMMMLDQSRHKCSVAFKNISITISNIRVDTISRNLTMTNGHSSFLSFKLLNYIYPSVHK